MLNERGSGQQEGVLLLHLLLLYLSSLFFSCVLHPV